MQLFTGIVEEVGKISGIRKGVRSSVLTVRGDLIFDDLKQGDSVAVNGVCLTVTERSRNTFTADVMNETLSRSSLGALTTGSRVNLERAMPANGRFGGHIVTGHIDGTGVITGIKADDIAVVYTIGASDKLMKYIVEKGSVAIDGISLTVASAGACCFSVSVIPHTAKHTSLSEKSAGGSVNIENDIVGKYIEKLLRPEQDDLRGQSGITEDFLAKYGF